MNFLKLLKMHIDESEKMRYYNYTNAKYTIGKIRRQDMKKNDWIKTTIKQENISQVELSAELKKSEDSISRITNNPTEAPLSSLLKLTDYIGVPTDQFIKGISDNRNASDGLLPVDKRFRSFKEGVARCISESANSSSEGWQQVKKIVDTLTKTALVYVTGGFACGKFSAAENFIGTSFRTVGEKARSYERMLIKSDCECGIEFNYPLGEYLYEVDSAEILPDVVESSNSQKLIHDRMIPAPWGRSSDSNYVLFSSAEKLHSGSVICSNWINSTPADENADTSAEIETQLIALSDVVVIMLEQNTANLEKYMPILQSAFENWKWELPDHLIFVASKSDRYSVEEAESICRNYSDMISSAMRRIVGDNDEAQSFVNTMAGMVFPYSSIYKVNTQGKNDAGLNMAFTHRLQQDLSFSIDAEKRSIQLVQALTSLKNHYQSDGISEQDIDNMKQEICRMTEKASADFRTKFDAEYDKVINVEYISRIISDNNIERKQEDRKRLVTIVNSQITRLARKAVLNSLEGMKDELEALGADLVGEKRAEAIHDCISTMCKKLSFSDMKTETNSGKYPTMESINDVLSGLTLATALLPVAGITMGLTSLAATAVTSYYAQTNFEKNMARKIVSSYDSHDVKKKISDRMVIKYFEPLKSDLLFIAGGAESQSDPDAVALIERILAFVGGQNLQKENYGGRI